MTGFKIHAYADGVVLVFDDTVVERFARASEVMKAFKAAKWANEEIVRVLAKMRTA